MLLPCLRGNIGAIVGPSFLIHRRCREGRRFPYEREKRDKEKTKGDDREDSRRYDNGTAKPLKSVKRLRQQQTQLSVEEEEQQGTSAAPYLERCSRSVASTLKADFEGFLRLADCDIKYPNTYFPLFHPSLFFLCPLSMCTDRFRSTSVIQRPIAAMWPPEMRFRRRKKYPGERKE